MTGDPGTALDRFADLLEQHAMRGAAQRFVMQLAVCLFCVGGLALAALSPLAGIALIAPGMSAAWLLYATGAHDT